MKIKEQIADWPPGVEGRTSGRETIPADSVLQIIVDEPVITDGEFIRFYGKFNRHLYSFEAPDRQLAEMMAKHLRICKGRTVGSIAEDEMPVE
jgi:hypothetical protein